MRMGLPLPDTEKPEAHQQRVAYAEVRILGVLDKRIAPYAKELEPPAPRWSEWWVLDGPPAHAAIEVARNGYRVVECVLDRVQHGFLAAAKLRWLRTLAGYWSDKPRRAA